MLIGLWKQLGKPAEFHLAASLLLSAAAGAFGVFLLGLSGWFLTAAALAGLAGGGYVFNHLYPSAGVRGAAFGRVGTRYAEQLVGHDATLRLSAKMRPMVFRQGAKTVRGFASMPTADLSALIDDVEEIEGGFLRIFSPAAAVLASMAVALGFTFAADLLTGILALTGFTFVIWLIRHKSLYAGKALTQSASRQLADAREHVSRLVENAVELEIIGVLTKAALAAELELKTHQEAADRAEKPFRRVGLILGLIGGGLVVLVLWRVGLEGPLAVSAGAALSLLAAFDASSALIKAFNAWPSAQSAAARMTERLCAPQTVQEPSMDTAAELDSIFPVKAEKLVASPAPDGPFIGPVDLTISGGDIVEILGPSGSGKTTLAEALMKLQPVHSGKLSYAGASDDDLRVAGILSRIALSPQFPAFLPGNLRSQLLFAKPDATDADLWKALESSCINATVSAKPDGLDTPFENGQGGFSGGELRRIGLARAILADPQILVLDEPFAGLETALIHKISANLGDWVRSGDRAVILLQHASRDLDWGDLEIRSIFL